MKQEKYPENLYVSHFIEDGVIHPHLYVAGDLEKSRSVKYIRADSIFKWHKHPDEKPKDKGWYLVSVKDNESGKNIVTIALYSLQNTWSIGLFWAPNIIAWMELPKPYKEE